MTQTPFTLPECPKPVAALLSKLPSLPPSLLLASALNIGLAAQLPADVREHLRGRTFRIHIRDARVTMDFTWDGQRFRALARQPSPDLVICATGPDFLLLAQRKVDADTLFFARRLSMEGDTELGLVVKNTLDALEMPVLDLQRFARKPHHAAAPSPWRH